MNGIFHKQTANYYDFKDLFYEKSINCGISVSLCRKYQKQKILSLFKTFSKITLKAKSNGSLSRLNSAGIQLMFYKLNFQFVDECMVSGTIKQDNL